MWGVRSGTQLLVHARPTRTPLSTRLTAENGWWRCQQLDSTATRVKQVALSLTTTPKKEGFHGVARRIDLSSAALHIQIFYMSAH